MRNELYHYGIKGMKWGIRRFQNKDGTWTSEGKARYGVKRNTVKTQKSNSGVFNKANIEKKDYGGCVVYTYRSNSSQGKRNFDKIANREDVTVYEISDRITAPTQKAIRIFMQAQDTDEGMEKATASLAKDLGDLNFNVQFERYDDGYATGSLSIIGNDRYYSCGFEEDYMDDEGIYDVRTNDPIEGVW